MSAVDAITIRDCATLEDFRQGVAVQKHVWGFDDEDLIPIRMFVVARKVEGQVIGAFDAAGAMVGFCLAVPALHGPAAYLHSHMLAVLPEHRRAGIGYRLKLEQRRKALEKGIHLIEWTFDPLEWKNAAFNLNRLGAIARRYVPNLYGVSSSPLHRGLPTDRLIAEWWLDSARVIDRIGALVDSPKASSENPRTPPAAEDRVTFPLDTVEHSTPSLSSTEARDSHSVSEVQSRLRKQLQDGFARGLAATGFHIEEGTAAYLLGQFQKDRPP